MTVTAVLGAVTATAVLGAVASVVYLIRLLPQPIRMVRTGDVAGVSALAALNALVADVAWLVYGLSAHILVVWLVTLPAIVLALATLTLLRRTITAGDAAIASGWTAVIVALGSVHLLAVALAVTVLVTGGPAIWSAFTHSSPSGVARSTWLIALLDATTWGGYGVALGDAALEMYGVVLLATATAILLRLRAWNASPLSTSAVGPGCAGPHS